MLAKLNYINCGVMVLWQYNDTYYDVVTELYPPNFKLPKQIGNFGGFLLSVTN